MGILKGERIRYVYFSYNWDDFVDNVINWNKRSRGRYRSWVGKGGSSEHPEFQLPLEHVGGKTQKIVRNTDLEVSKCDRTRDRNLRITGMKRDNNKGKCLESAGELWEITQQIWKCFTNFILLLLEQLNKATRSY